MRRAERAKGRASAAGKQRGLLVCWFAGLLVCWFAGLPALRGRCRASTGVHRAFGHLAHSRSASAGSVPFSESARRGQKMAVCDELHIANLSLKSPTWENDRERMPRCPKAPIRTHISTFFVHDLPLGLNLLFGTKAGRSRAKPMSRIQRVNRTFEHPKRRQESPRKALKLSVAHRF